MQWRAPGTQDGKIVLRIRQNLEKRQQRAKVRDLSTGREDRQHKQAIELVASTA